MKIINMTPHSIVVSQGDNVETFEPCGTVIRMETIEKPLTPVNGFEVVSTSIVDHNLPDQVSGVMLLVSSMVLASFPNRKDLIAPNTGRANRNEKGHIVSVPGFISNP